MSSRPLATSTESHQARQNGKDDDNIGPLDIKRLPYRAKAKFLDLHHQCELMQSWPWQWLINLVMLQRKPALGNDRAIGLVVWLVRLWCAIRSDTTRSWTAERKPSSAQGAFPKQDTPARE